VTVEGRATVDSQRVVTLDALRGFALLGILIINALAFGLPIAAYENPHALEPLRGPIAGGELATWDDDARRFSLREPVRAALWRRPGAAGALARRGRRAPNSP
jgi:hypothetical protein